MKKRTNLSFIVELLILFLLLIMMITVITMVSIRARGQSRKARVLTDAVICAENATEMTEGAKDPDEAAARLEQMEGVSSVQVDGDVISFKMDFSAGSKPEQSFEMKVNWDEEPGETGAYIEKTVEVFEADGKEPVYSLESGSFVKDEEETR